LGLNEENTNLEMVKVSEMLSSIYTYGQSNQGYGMNNGYFSDKGDLFSDIKLNTRLNTDYNVYIIYLNTSGEFDRVLLDDAFFQKVEQGIDPFVWQKGQMDGI